MKGDEPMPDYVLKALFVLTGLLLLVQLAPIARHAARAWVRWLCQAVSGLCLLLVANMVGSAFGLGLGLNALTLPVSAALGPPGVAVLWALRYFL
jgi:pro-sigmaK processing inhibitor BofA